MQFALLRYLVDGIRIQDLLPAYDAIMENLGEGRKFGIYAFVVMSIALIFKKVIKRAVDFDIVGDVDKSDGVIHEGKNVSAGIFHHSKFKRRK